MKGIFVFLDVGDVKRLKKGKREKKEQKGAKKSKNIRIIEIMGLVPRRQKLAPKRQLDTGGCQVFEDFWAVILTVLAVVGPCRRLTVVP